MRGKMDKNNTLEQAISRALKTYASQRFHYFKPEAKGGQVVLGKDLEPDGFLTKRIVEAITQQKKG